MKTNQVQKSPGSGYEAPLVESVDVFVEQGFQMSVNPFEDEEEIW